MAVRTNGESMDGAKKVSRKSGLQEVQQALDLVRSQIRQFDFTPEQVFGYHGKADVSNLKSEESGASVPAVAKKAARKTAAVKRAASGDAPRKTGEGGPAAKRTAKAASVAEGAPAVPTASNTVKTSLNPASAWPFPAGSRR
ncbi:hypothetical protein LMG27952_06910 [Paraburkholderia hiiakae]|uniref:Uncharacterized protein n=2 Tax=Paraburkholderia hiiakae TaxID=1081782 RepID=A0ABM8P932_9BURK|nr:hypothetical protein LMG27952_06910 [Paraburkholderia hiiakae]